MEEIKVFVRLDQSQDLSSAIFQISRKLGGMKSSASGKRNMVRFFFRQTMTRGLQLPCTHKNEAVHNANLLNLFIGDVVYIDLMGKHLLVINSYEDAEQLATKRSRIYSGRPYVRMFADL